MPISALTPEVVWSASIAKRTATFGFSVRPEVSGHGLALGSAAMFRGDGGNVITFLSFSSGNWLPRQIQPSYFR